jgi:hypothetical protein
MLQAGAAEDEEDMDSERKKIQEGKRKGNENIDKGQRRLLKIIQIQCGSTGVLKFPGKFLAAGQTELYPEPGSWHGRLCPAM